MKRALSARLLRWLASAAIVSAIVYVLQPIPGIGPTTVSMLLLLAVLAIAARWGTSEAAIASVAGGLLFDYFFLPPRGLSIDQPQHLVTLLAFLVTAMVTGRYSSRLRQRAREATRQRAELEQLYGLAEVMLMSNSFESAIKQVVQQAPGIFGAREAAFYDAGSGIFVRSSVEACAGLEEKMRNGAQGVESGAGLVAVRSGTRTIGNLAIRGAAVSDDMLKYVGHALAVGLERALALEEAARTVAARESEELRSTVLEALAHDLKTPLTSIKAAVTSLLALGDPDRRELLSIIDEETDRLDRLSSQAIEMERIGIGMLHAEKQSHDLRQAIVETIEELGPVLRTRTIQIEFAETLPTAEFDPRLIKEALRQLLDNARKYSPEGSPIGVACRPTEGNVIVQIADLGSGVPEEERERVFEKFYHGTSTASAGIGLGLPIARSVVKAHGGQIWLTSRLGRGTVFHFSLPSCKTAGAG